MTWETLPHVGDDAIDFTIYRYLSLENLMPSPNNEYGGCERDSSCGGDDDDVKKELKKEMLMPSKQFNPTMMEKTKKYKKKEK